MNTTAKGDLLENQVFDLFESEINNGKFIAQRQHCRIYAKKGYYSHIRKRDIVFDIAIEVFLPNQPQDRYSFLFLIECKNYRHKVPVDDVEEFYAKIQQISPAAVKGIVVSNNAFQGGAFEFAKTTGMGLLRYFDKSNLDWVLNRSPSFLVTESFSNHTSANAYRGLNTEGFRSSHFDCYCFVDSNYTNSLTAFLVSLIALSDDNDSQALLKNVRTAGIKEPAQVEFIENAEIEALSLSILEEISYKFGEVPLNHVCNYLNDKLGLKVSFDETLPSGVLGQVSFDPLEISIDVEQCESDEIMRFTLAHELGHVILEHSDYMNSEQCHESSLELENTIDLGIKDIMRMEWQANYFASSLLLPKDSLLNIMSAHISKQDIVNRGYGIIYLDEQKCNIDIYYQITNALMKRFNVSRTVVKIRLIKLGLLNEVKLINPSSHGIFKPVV